MLTYAIYCRRSQERDETQVQSLDDQLRSAHRISAAANLEVASTITESRSAKEPYRREGFSQLIRLIERGEVQGVIAWHPDRLSRNEIDAATLTYLVRKGKLKDLQFGNYTFDNSPEGIMMLQLALSQSQYFSSKLARDVKRGMTTKVEQGWMPHRAPEGYLNVTVMEGYVPLHKIARDEERFPLIRAFWSLVLSGNYSVPQALDRLNSEWGYRTRASPKRGGTVLSRPSAYKLLNNPFYMGYFRESGQLHKGAHEPMVTAEEFERVQQILKRTGRPQPKKRLFAYTGLIQCVNCGCMVTASYQRGRHGRGNYVYYHCTNGKRLCDKRSISDERLEAMIDEQLARIQISDTMATFLLDLIDQWDGRRGATEQSISQQQLEAAESARHQLAVLLDLRLQERITDEVFSEKQAILQRELAQLEETKQATDLEMQRVAASARGTVAFRLGARNQFLAGSVEERRTVAAALCTKYSFDHGQIQMEAHPALAGIATIEPLKSSLQNRVGGAITDPASHTTRHAGPHRAVHTDANDRYRSCRLA